MKDSRAMRTAKLKSASETSLSNGSNLLGFSNEEDYSIQRELEIYGDVICGSNDIHNIGEIAHVNLGEEVIGDFPIIRIATKKEFIARKPWALRGAMFYYAIIAE